VIYTLGLNAYQPDALADRLRELSLSAGTPIVLLDTRSSQRSRESQYDGRDALVRLCPPGSGIKWLPELGGHPINSHLYLPDQHISYPAWRGLTQVRAGAAELLERDARGETVVVLCACADPSTCHRVRGIEPLLREAGRQAFELDPTGARIALADIYNSIDQNQVLTSASPIPPERRHALPKGERTVKINDIKGLDLLAFRLDTVLRKADATLDAKRVSGAIVCAVADARQARMAIGRESANVVLDLRTKADDFDTSEMFNPNGRKLNPIVLRANSERRRVDLVALYAGRYIEEHQPLILCDPSKDTDLPVSGWKAGLALSQAGISVSWRLADDRLIDINTMRARLTKDRPMKVSATPCDLDPDSDGKTHINVFSGGRTWLGRQLTNFARTPFVVDGEEWASMEAFWFGSRMPAGPYRDAIRGLHGHEARSAGQEYERTVGRLSPKDDSPEFQASYEKAFRIKLDTHPSLALALAQSDLPLRHYYSFKDGTVKDAGYKWMTAFMEHVREELQQRIPDLEQAAARATKRSNATRIVRDPSHFIGGEEQVLIDRAAQAAMGASLTIYDEEHCAAISSIKRPNGLLAPMAHTPIRIPIVLQSGDKSVIVQQKANTTEALFHALRRDDLPSLQAQLLADSSPVTARQRAMAAPGRESYAVDLTQGNKRAERARVKLQAADDIETMRAILRLKVAQNSGVRDALLATGDRPIVYFTKDDPLWGTIRAAGGGIGYNLYGQLLEEIRSELQADPHAFDKVFLPVRSLQGWPLASEANVVEQKQQHEAPLQYETVERQSRVYVVAGAHQPQVNGKKNGYTPLMLERAAEIGRRMYPLGYLLRCGLAPGVDEAVLKGLSEAIRERIGNDQKAYAREIQHSVECWVPAGISSNGDYVPSETHMRVADKYGIPREQVHIFRYQDPRFAWAVAAATKLHHSGKYLLPENAKNDQEAKEKVFQLNAHGRNMVMVAGERGNSGAEFMCWGTLDQKDGVPRGRTGTAVAFARNEGNLLFGEVLSPKNGRYSGIPDFDITNEAQWQAWNRYVCAIERGDLRFGDGTTGHVIERDLGNGLVAKQPEVYVAPRNGLRVTSDSRLTGSIPDCNNGIIGSVTFEAPIAPLRLTRAYGPKASFLDIHPRVLETIDDLKPGDRVRYQSKHVVDHVFDADGAPMAVLVPAAKTQITFATIVEHEEDGLIVDRDGTRERVSSDQILGANVQTRNALDIDARGAYLPKSNWSNVFVNLDARGATLDEAFFANSGYGSERSTIVANLLDTSLRHTTFEDCHLLLRNARRADLSEARFSGCEIDLHDEADERALSGLDFRSCTLEGVTWGPRLRELGWEAAGIKLSEEQQREFTRQREREQTLTRQGVAV
jgi:predicted NAD-dependent protein-ADP-ribosyltransferase YbiA (DUF1768 family)